MPVSEKRKYDSTVARIAGNLMSGVPRDWMPGAGDMRRGAVKAAVATARSIVEETISTEPAHPPERGGIVDAI